ncbi:hypothetical protein ES708_14301 [subsurface metagenome]
MFKSEIYRFIDYVSAKLKKGKIWHIEYYVKNPCTGEMVRKQIKCNRIKSITERREYAKQLAKEVNRKLKEGWNPF